MGTESEQALRPPHGERVVAIPSGTSAEEVVQRHADFSRPTLLVELGSARSPWAVLWSLRGGASSEWGPMPLLCQDLLNLAATVYLADISLPRTEAWVRDAAVLVPVSDPGYWQTQHELLSEVLYLLTRDNTELQFAKAGPAPVREQAVEGNVASGVVEADCVSLFSGGLDSYGGAAGLLTTDRRPLLVSLSSHNPTIGEAQRVCAQALRRRFSCAFTHATARIAARVSTGGTSGEEAEEREPSQRSRSFLFLACGIAAAGQCGARELYLFENGVLATHIPFSAARLGSLSTRTADPRLLQLMQTLAENVLGRALVISNPFQTLTKAEVIWQTLRPHLKAAEIQSAVSCWQAGRTPRPCGGCVPCLLRRVSVLAAGLPDEAYMMDLLTDPDAHRDTEGFANLADMLIQARDFLSLTDNELRLKYPELLDFGETGAGPEQVIAVYRRHARELTEVLGGYAKGSCQSPREGAA